MIKVATTLLCFFSALAVSAAQPMFYRYPKVNFGAKGGFAATSMIMHDIHIDGHHIDDFQMRSQVGYFMSMFTRLNINKLYLQTEITLNNSRSSVSFDRNNWNINSIETDLSTFSTEWINIEVPLLIGYNFVREGPYKMSAFAGPKLKIPIMEYSKATFANFPHTNLTENVYPYVIDLTIGLGCTIGRVIFDFSYDLGLVNISKGINFDTSNNDPATAVVLDRHTGVLAFSLGVFF